MPSDPEYASQTAKMKAVQAPLLSEILCPSFARVQKCEQDAGSVNLHLGAHCQVFAGPHPLDEFGLHCGGIEHREKDPEEGWGEHTSLIMGTGLLLRRRSHCTEHVRVEGRMTSSDL